MTTTTHSEAGAPSHGPTAPPPAAAAPLATNRGDAPAYWQLDILWEILASGDQTGGSYSMMEELCPKDSGPPPHTHDQDEALYVIDGALTCIAGDRTLTATAGTWVAIPRGTVHSFRVDSETARILNLYVPAGFEQTVIELGEPAPSRTLPPKGRPPHATREAMMRAMAAHGMHAVPGPDTLRQGPGMASDPRMAPDAPV